MQPHKTKLKIMLSNQNETPFFATPNDRAAEKISRHAMR